MIIKQRNQSTWLSSLLWRCDILPVHCIQANHVLLVIICYLWPSCRLNPLTVECIPLLKVPMSLSDASRFLADESTSRNSGLSCEEFALARIISGVTSGVRGFFTSKASWDISGIAVCGNVTRSLFITANFIEWPCTVATSRGSHW